MSEQQKEDQSVVTKGPGYLLQAARIEQGISIDDIARQMNLNARILHLIEEDDYREIQSPIFIRGYLRTYARLVGVDEDNTIKIFGEYYQKDDPDIKAIGNTVPQISSNDIRVKWMTYAVIIGLIALLSVWWMNNYKMDEPVTAISDTANTKTDTTGEVSREMTYESISGNSVNNTDLETSSLGGQNFETPMDKLEQTEAEVLNQERIDNEEESTRNNESAISEEMSTATEEPALVQKPQDNNQEIPAVEALTPVEVSQLVAESGDSELNEVITKTYTKEIAAPAGNDVLEINVVATSWADIRDNNNVKLVQDLMNSGDSLRLQGQKPFKIFLGNGYGVELVLNGKIIDFSQYIKSSNNTARFELEQ